VTLATRLFLVSLATFVAGVALASLGYGLYARQRYGPERTFSQAIRSGDRCVVGIGDSRMVEGFDRGVLERGLAARGNPRCVASLAIGALKLPGQMVALRRYLDARRPWAVVLGVSDGTLLPAPERSDPTEMVGNRAVELLWSNADERDLLYPDTSLATQDARLRHMLLLGTSLGSYGSLAWITVQSLQDRVAGTDDVATNRFGRVSDMMALESGFRAGALANLARWDGRFELSPWFERASELTADRGVPLIVVSVPMRSRYRRALSQSPPGQRYRAWLTNELAKRRGVIHVDLSAAADDTAFMDGVHLSPTGAAAFSDRLAEALAALDAGARSGP
jgi:hypothetical protein